MRSFEELDALWRDVPPTPRDRGTIELIVIRPAEAKRKVLDRVELSPERGIHGDRWGLDSSPNPDCQVSVMNARVGELVAHGEPLELFGNNFLVDLDLSQAAAPAGTKLRLGTALIQVTALPHFACDKYRRRFGDQALRWTNIKPHRAQRRRGIYCRVLEAGVVKVGDAIEVWKD